MCFTIHLGTDEVYSQLLRCFEFEPAARPRFEHLNEFFMGLVPDSLEARGSMMSNAPKPAEVQDQHYLSLLHDHTGGDPDVFNELREGGDIVVNDTYGPSFTPCVAP